MPEIIVYAVEGRTAEQKKSLMKDITDAVVKNFVIASMFWAIVAFLVGVYIASELAWPKIR